MYKTSAALFLSAILLSVVPARAKGSLPTHTASITIAGTGSDITGSGTGGACGSVQTSDPWVDHCSADTGCTCIQFMPTKVSKGQTVTDFFVTVDSNLNPAVGSTVGGGPTPSCGALYGAFNVTSSSKSEAVNLLGVVCKTVTGISKTNPSGNNVGNSLGGGWGLDETVSSPNSSGWGTFTGKTVKATSSFSVTANGLVTQ